MRDPNRIPKIVGRLMGIWMKYPDMRLGQLLANVAESKQSHYSSKDYNTIEAHAAEFADLYSVEDDEIIRRLEKMYP